MNSQSYKTTVGAFVLGGLALLVLGIILLGGGRLFSNDLEYVMYFDGSVSGLATGAPVVFRGVPMGSVTRINLVANSRDSNVTIPVYIRIDERSLVRASGSTSPSESFQQEIIRRMVQRGLRGRLQLQSLITGQYRVELDFYPATSANFRSATPDMEIPTIPSPIDTLQSTLSQMPLEQMVNSFSAVLQNLALGLSVQRRGRGSLPAAQQYRAGSQKPEHSQRCRWKGTARHSGLVPRGHAEHVHRRRAVACDNSVGSGPVGARLAHHERPAPPS